MQTDGELKALYRARICKHGFSAETMFYRTDAQHKHKLAAVAQAIRSTEDWPRKLLLDVGCGYGALLEHVQVRRYLGIDIVPEFLEEAKRRNPTHEFCLASARETEAESFDTCVLAGVLSGVPSPQDLILQTFRIARERVIFDVTLADRVPYEFGDLNRWSLDEVETVAHHAGYTLTSKTDFGHSWLVLEAVRRPGHR